jgi:hypothetical protein
MRRGFQLSVRTFFLREAISNFASNPKSPSGDDFPEQSRFLSMNWDGEHRTLAALQSMTSARDLPSSQEGSRVMPLFLAALNCR